MKIKLSPRISVGTGQKPIFIAGPCVIESEAMCLSIARVLKRISGKLKVPIIFKASFDKANRSSIRSFRGPGLEKGLAVLEKVKEKTGLLITTDIHEPYQAEIAAKVADILQIPAYLCRQTDLLVAAAGTGKVVNVKKGQFLAPGDIKNIHAKVKAAGNRKMLITERGSCFGYHNLVVDMKGIPQMRSLGLPVIFDATHSVQQPGSGKGITLGDPGMILPLARAAAGAGVDGFFMEVHPNPKRAKSDAANSLPLGKFEGVVKVLLDINKIVR